MSDPLLNPYAFPQTREGILLFHHNFPCEVPYG